MDYVATILELLRVKPMTSRELGYELHVTPNTARVIANKLVEQNILRREPGIVDDHTRKQCTAAYYYKLVDD